MALGQASGHRERFNGGRLSRPPSTRSPAVSFAPPVKEAKTSAWELREEELWKDWPIDEEKTYEAMHEPNGWDFVPPSPWYADLEQSRARPKMQTGCVSCL